MVTDKEINKLKKIWDDWESRDLTDDERDYQDNFPYIFTQAMLCDFNPDWCKQIVNHLSKALDDSYDLFDEYVKVVRCGSCKWWKDNKCTNANGAYGNLILNPNWFCRSGMSVLEDI